MIPGQLDVFADVDPRRRSEGGHRGWASIRVPRMLLLGVHVQEVHARLDPTEHERRTRVALGPITNPGLLDRLLDLPVGIPAADPIAWTELAFQPTGIVERADDGCTVTRLIHPPLRINEVVAGRGRTLKAVQDASMFADYAPRWVSTNTGSVSDAVALEAHLYGVGVRTDAGTVLVHPEKRTATPIDRWSWIAQEDVYARWIKANA